MNFVFISPNFPVRYFKWVEALRDHGVNVLGIGDSPYYETHDRLKAALREYYFVGDMSNYDNMYRAVAYFEKKYGKIDFIESNNEWWLTMDAKLREAFGVTSGQLPAQMESIKAKSAMKEYFKKGGAKTMRYTLVDGRQDEEKVRKFIEEVGFPVFVKPNVGVGASDSYAVHNEKELQEFLDRKLVETYIMEELVEGYIVSYDGLVNEEGDVVFSTADHFPTPIDKLVSEQADVIYYDNPFSLPFEDLDGAKFEKLGRSVVKAFNIKKRPFHVEFFVLTKDKPGLGKKGEVLGLECNMRSPGGYTPDLMNYGNSISIYQMYADIICYNENRQPLDLEKFYAFAVSRRKAAKYVHSEEEILTKYHNSLNMHGRYPAHIAHEMGDFYYYAKFKTLKEGKEFAAFVTERVKQ